VLVDRPLPTLAHVLAAGRDLRAAGPETVVVTSVLGEGVAAEEMATVAVDGDSSWIVTTPQLPHPAKGAGDLLAALFLAHRLDARSVTESLARAVSSVFSVIHATIAADADELVLIGAQDTLIRPVARFAARRIG
jgi:pyridoxine kinase